MELIYDWEFWTPVYHFMILLFPKLQKRQFKFFKIKKSIFHNFPTLSHTSTYIEMLRNKTFILINLIFMQFYVVFNGHSFLFSLSFIFHLSSLNYYFRLFCLYLLYSFLLFLTMKLSRNKNKEKRKKLTASRNFIMNFWLRNFLDDNCNWCVLGLDTCT